MGSLRVRHAFLVSASVAVLCTSQVHAQGRTAAPDAQAGAITGSGALEEIIVTAQRRSENLQRTPVAISALSADALKQRSIVTESDLQLAVPGLTARQTLDSNGYPLCHPRADIRVRHGFSGCRAALSQ